MWCEEEVACGVRRSEGVGCRMAVGGGGGQAASRVRLTGRHTIGYVRRSPRHNMSAVPRASDGTRERGAGVGSGTSVHTHVRPSI